LAEMIGCSNIALVGGNCSRLLLVCEGVCTAGRCRQSQRGRVQSHMASYGCMPTQASEAFRKRVIQLLRTWVYLLCSNHSTQSAYDCRNTVLLAPI